MILTLSGINHFSAKCLFFLTPIILYKHVCCLHRLFIVFWFPIGLSLISIVRLMHSQCILHALITLLAMFYFPPHNGVIMLCSVELSVESAYLVSMAQAFCVVGINILTVCSHLLSITPLKSKHVTVFDCICAVVLLPYKSSLPECS